MSLGDQDAVERLIGSIYDAAVSALPWESVLSDIGSRIGASSAAAIWVDRGGQRLAEAQLWGMDSGLMQEYAQNWLAVCPRMRLGRTYAAGAVFDDRAAREQPGAVAREFYSFMDRHDSGLARVIVAERRSDLDIGISFYSRIETQEVPGTLELLEALSPHLRRAALLRHQVGFIRSRAAFAEMLHEASEPAVILGRSGRVFHVNLAAEVILARNDGLLLRRSKIGASTPNEEKGLYHCLARALACSPGDSPDAATLVRRPSGAPPLALSFTRIADAVNGFSKDSVAIMRIVELARRVSGPALRCIYGLSAAEADIAVALSRGASLEDIARQRDTSILTARTQLKSIFSKMEVRSQAQLAATVASLTGLVRGSTNSRSSEAATRARSSLSERVAPR